MMPRPPARRLPRRSTAGAVIACLLALVALGCSDDSGEKEPEVKGDPAAEKSLRGVPETARWTMAGLHDEVIVVRTEGSVPHVYAHDRHDLAFVQGFLIASDRYFFVDMGRRLGLGRISGLLGDAGLAQDYESRHTGITSVAQNILKVATPEQQEIFGAFAAGINAWVARAKAGEVPLPSEVVIAAPMLGHAKASDMLQPFEVEDVAGFAAVLIYQLGYETGDVGRGQTVKKLETYFEGVAFAELRRKGAIADIWNDIRPPATTASAHGWGLETADGPPPPPPPDPTTRRARDLKRRLTLAKGPHVPEGMLDDLVARLERVERRLRHDHEVGFGSNAWAVAGTVSADGAALLASDGHLPLTIPSYFYQIGLDTQVLGGGGTHQAGLVIPGLPILAVGTNGHIAWSQTQLFGDITDWYVEELALDAQGAPATTLFKGAKEPVQVVPEKYTSIALDALLPDLKSAGGEETWNRYMTFDGRRIMQIEGVKVKKDHKAAAGETVVNLGGSFVVPGDTDGDGKITAISADYTGWDEGNVLKAVEGFGHAKDVEGFRQATRSLVAYSQNFAVADEQGDILYSGYQAVPCRGYLDREADGAWKDGADPSGLLDGTRYGAFTIPIKDGVVDEAPGKTDPYRCVVPFDKYPQALSPKRGWVVTANNDVGNFTLDNSLTDEPWYIGGPWLAGYRAERIATLLEQAAQAKTADVPQMSSIQADVRSPLGARYTPFLLGALDLAAGKAKSGGKLAQHEQRLVDLYNSVTPTVMVQVRGHLEKWKDVDYAALSGVETFYHQPASGEASAAVATMIFNAWIGRFQDKVFGDEPMPGIWRFSGSTGRARALQRFTLQGRGADNPANLASFNKETGESIFFDVLGTEAVERSEEVALMALKDALAFLGGPAGKQGTGGFGTWDVTRWLWGLRHQVKFESTIGDFFDDGGNLKALTDQFAITTKKHPLADKFEPGDPRIGLKWFPRSGDAFAVDAAGGLGTTGWHYGSGPVFRMVIGLKKGKVSGVNIVPGGQSALKDSDYFADQAAAWLGNKAWPLRFHVEEVVAGAKGREMFVPTAAR